MIIMYGLLYKELVLNKKNLFGIAMGELTVSSLVLLPLIFNDSNEEAQFIMGVLSIFVFFMMFPILGMMTASIFETDEIKKWAYFVASSPVTKVGHIQAKYLFTLLLYITLFMWCYFLTAVSAVFGGSANLMIAFEMLWIMLLTNAIEFPFIVRFGSKFGGYVKTAITTALALAAFEFFLFGNISAFSDPEKILALFERLSDAAAMSDISLIVLAAFPFVSAGLYFLSYKISCKLYLKGAEEYA